MRGSRATRWNRAVRLLLAAAVAATALAVSRPAPAEEGYDLMRVITTQWVKPFIVIAFDKSGSMRWTADESDSTWNFQYSGSIQGYVYSQPDWTHGHYGRGQGFWMRVAQTEVLAQPPNDFPYDGNDLDLRTNAADVSAGSRWLYYPQSAGLRGPQRGDLIRIVDFPDPSVNGIYIVQSTSTSGTRYRVRLRRQNPDGTFSTSTYRFPQDASGFTIESVDWQTDPAGFTARSGWDNSGSYTANRSYINVSDASKYRQGDIVELSGFSGNRDGYYLVRRVVTSSDRLYLARLSGNIFHNATVNFGSASDSRIRVRKIWPPREAHTIWYFVPPSRIAIAKNVLGDTVTIYEPAIPPSGWDDRNKPYYEFDGPGPVNGAWKEWRGSGDNGSGGVWHNWSSSLGAPPAGDPQYTTEVPPSDMVSRFSQVADLGLVYYPRTYDCSKGEPTAVQINPDDNDQSAVVAELHGYFDYVGNGGLSPGGGTPSRAALLGAKKELERAYGADPKKSCGRTYGVILLTDGQSNRCNYGGSYCWRDPWTHRCDGSNPGFDCPGHWQQYPAGIADQLWKLSVNGNALKVRTWAVGLSRGIGPCELNYTAFKGRTDASAPAGDGGFDLTVDPYLTPNDNDVFDYEVLNPEDGNPGHGMYAYFASGVAQLRDALVDILASLGTGDYTTSAPSVAGSALTAANMAFLPSSEYPTWRGHLRAYDQTYDQNTNSLVWTFRWDAGGVLSTGNAGYTRKIYTWDPRNNNALVEVTEANAAQLDAICGGCGIDRNVVRFIRGQSRPWLLGALINSTPAVIGPPEHWEQSTAERHTAFEQTYADRHTQVWIGSSDGMVHAFDLLDGAEILAIIPPDLLDTQVDLAARWWSDPSKFPVGQPRHPGDHRYGVANSIRFADVWDDTAHRFRTVMFITEGPGGTGVHAIDVTHPYPGRTVGTETYPADPDYDPGAPFEVLWSRTRDGEAWTTALPQLGQTFSVPAVGIYKQLSNGRSASVLLLNEGWWPNETKTNRPYSLVLDPVDGAVLAIHQVSNANSSLVGNQTLADGVIWQTDATRYRPDNLVDEALVADLNGTLWSLTGSSFGTRSDLFVLGGDQPIYYSPAVAAYPVSHPSYDLFAFASGSFYEKSPAVTSPSSSFVPRLYIGVRSLTTGSTSHVGLPITDLPLPAGTVNPRDTDGNGSTFTPGAQVIASPLVLVPSAGSSGHPFALYLVYDPGGGLCVGKSYIVKVEFDPENLSSLLANPAAHVTSYEAGEGAAGGFAIAGEKVIVSQSGVGEGSEAHLLEVPDLTIQPGNSGNLIRWWMELQ